MTSRRSDGTHRALVLPLGCRWRVVLIVVVVVEVLIETVDVEVIVVDVIMT